MQTLYLLLGILALLFLLKSGSGDIKEGYYPWWRKSYPWWQIKYPWHRRRWRYPYYIYKHYPYYYVDKYQYY